MKSLGAGEEERVPPFLRREGGSKEDSLEGEGGEETTGARLERNEE